MKPSMSAKRMLEKREGKKKKKGCYKFVADICVSVNPMVEVWDGKACRGFPAKRR